MIKNYFIGIWNDRFILQSLVNKDLQLKYRRSKIGVAWSIITPLGLVLIIGIIYSLIFSTDPKTFIPMLFAGLNPWLFVSGTADGATISLMTAEGYLKQTSTSAQIFPLRVALVNFVNLLYSIITFFAIYLFLQPALFSAKMLMCIPGLLILFFFTLGIANFAAIFNLNMRDYQPLQSLILQALFYATPIIYQTSMLADKGFGFIYAINPMYYVIEIVRTPMQGAALPAPSVYLTAVIITALVFFFSILLFMRQKKEIIFKL